MNPKYGITFEPLNCPDNDYPNGLDWEMDLDEDGRGWYDSGLSDNKCVLD